MLRGDKLAFAEVWMKAAIPVEACSVPAARLIDSYNALFVGTAGGSDKAPYFLVAFGRFVVLRAYASTVNKIDAVIEFSVDHERAFGG